jgi:aflatoxin B1 aldehyde reductase
MVWYSMPSGASLLQRLYFFCFVLSYRSSIAAGFLSGSVTAGSAPGTRFDGDGAVSQYMHRMYDNVPLHNAQRKLAESTKELGISPIEAALRWAMYHSVLQGGDGIILGASKEAQIVR